VSKDAVGPIPDRAESAFDEEETTPFEPGKREDARLNGSEIGFKPNKEPRADASTPPPPPDEASFEPFATDSEGDAAPFEPLPGFEGR